MVVGAPYHTVGQNAKQGSVYIFDYSSSYKNWIQQAEIHSSDGGADDIFGSALDISGSLIVVGARNHDVGSNANQGAAYQFSGSGSTWSQTAKLTSSDGGARENFGSSVAISGAVVIAAPNHSTSTHSGSAYVFTAGTQQSKLTASNGYPLDHLGISVAISGDTAVAGADNRNYGTGTAYVYSFQDSNWVQQAELSAPDGKSDDRFGRAVAVDGSTVVVGAPGQGTIHSQPVDSVYIFEYGSGEWTQSIKLTNPNPHPKSSFGYVIAVSGSTLVVSDSGYNNYQGAVYVYTKGTSGWALQATVTASDGEATDNFGAALALSGSTLAVSSPYREKGKGAVYVFSGSGTSWTQQAQLTRSQGSESDNFGFSLGLNGQSLLIGAWGQTVDKDPYRGAVYFTSKKATAGSTE